MAGHTTKLCAGIATLLAAKSVARWQPDGAYAASGTPVPVVVIGVLPQSPDAVVALSAYSVSDDPVYGDSITGVQVRTRTPGADPRTTDDLADQVFGVLHGLHGVLLGEVPVVQMWRQSWAPLGRDESQRYERSDNFYVETLNPAEQRL